MSICSCFLSQVSLQPGMDCGQIPKQCKVTFSDTQVTGDPGVLFSAVGAFVLLVFFSLLFFFPWWEGCYNHYFTPWVLRLTEIRGDTIREADKHWRLLHSALVVTILRLCSSCSLGFLTWNNWQLCSAGAPEGCLPPSLLLSRDSKYRSLCAHTRHTNTHPTAGVAHRDSFLLRF